VGRHIHDEGDGTFTVTSQGTQVPFPVPSTQQAELRELLGLRDRTVALLEAEAACAENTDGLQARRTELREAYEAYVRAHGPLNRYTTVSTSKVDAHTGEPVMSRRRPPVMAKLRSDPFSPLVIALERFDAASQVAPPATNLTERVIVPRTPLRGCDPLTRP
jgi:N12 class adenine-specific DNA methylase